MPTNCIGHEDTRRLQRAAHHNERDLARHKPDAAHEIAPLYTHGPISAKGLTGRGNAPVRAAMLQRAQQTYGNRAVQRALRSWAAPSGSFQPVQREVSDGTDLDGPPVQVPTVHLKGKPHVVTHYGKGGLKLQGKTKATFDGGVVETKDQVTEAATGCKGCKDESCVLVKGTVAMTFTATTKVTLPSVPKKKPKLTPCQKAIVQDAIDTTLSDHEDEHVAAFEQYNGTVDEPFELTTCQKKSASAVKKLANNRLKAVEKDRRKEAKDASAALDPFNFDLDLSCEEPAPEEATQGTSGGNNASGVVDVEI